MNWQTFKSLREGRFDNVDLGGRGPDEMVKRFRRQMAQNIQEMIGEKLIDPNMTIAQFLQFLES